MRIAKTVRNNETLHRNENEIYKFLECEQVEKKLSWRKKWKFRWGREKENLLEKGYMTKNLVKARNCGVISVAAYMMSICNFRGKELDQLDK